MSDTYPLFHDHHGDLEAKIITLAQNGDPVARQEEYHYLLLDSLIALTFRIQAIEDGTSYSHKN